MADGRVLMFAEYGPADGLPVLTFHALPLLRDKLQRPGLRTTLYAAMLFFIITNAGIPGAFIYFRF